MTPREMLVRSAAQKLHARGVMPTSRRVLAELKGGTVKDYAHGMGSRDVNFLRAAMLDLGYLQKAKTGRWYHPDEVRAVLEVDDPDRVPELDEVRCTEGCRNQGVHTLADHLRPGLDELLQG